MQQWGVICARLWWSGCCFWKERGCEGFESGMAGVLKEHGVLCGYPPVLNEHACVRVLHLLSLLLFLHCNSTLAH